MTKTEYVESILKDMIDAVQEYLDSDDIDFDANDSNDN